MCEILFRGKRKSDEQWIYGRLSYNGLGDTMKIIENNFFKEIQIMSDTIGQYTGLTDKNGKKIFEGDIVQHDFGVEQIGVQYAVVEYDSKYASFMIKPLCDWMYCEKDDCEVIGNMHDNPELLEGGVK